MFLNPQIQKAKFGQPKKVMPEKRQYPFRTSNGEPIVLELFLNPGTVFDRQQIEDSRFKGFFEKEYDFRNRGNRHFLQKAEVFKDAWMAGKFGSPYQAPVETRNVGRIFIPPTDESQEVELARV